MAKPLDLIDHKFGRLIVVQKLANCINYKQYWLCLCECGGHRVSSTGQLRSNRSKSCGCLYKEWLNKVKLPESESIYNKIYKSYKRHALARNLEWNIEKSYFYSLLKNKCHYCNKLPGQFIKKTKSNIAIYNGIDRKDNKKGYYIDNCVTCCRDCNYMKRDLTYESFLLHITNIYNNILK